MAPSWKRTSGDTGGTVAGLAAASSADGETVVYAATRVGVYRSKDAGRSWSLPGSTPTVAFAEAIAPSPHFARDRTLFAGGAEALYRSTDAGETWHQVLTGSHMLGVAAAPGEGPQQVLVLAATEYDGMLRSDDGGRNWSGANAGLLDLAVLSVALSPCFEADHTGFAGTASGLYRTRNGARSWREVDTGLVEPAVQCLAVSPNFDSDHLVLAGTEADGLLRSDDGGTSWSRPAELANTAITALAFEPGGRVVAAATNISIGISHDGGRTWQVQLPMDYPALSLAFVGDALLAGMLYRGIAHSEDAGVTWRPANSGLSARLDTDMTVLADGALLICSLEEDGLRISVDGGATWTSCFEGPVYGVAQSGSSLYAAAAAGLRVSQDRGATWAVPYAADQPVLAVAAASGMVLAALNDGDLLASDDNGQTWRRLPSPWANTAVIGLAVSPTYAEDRTFFVATGGETDTVLWRSIDAGRRWHRWFVGPFTGVTRLPIAVSPTYAIDGNVFVGAGGRVFRPLRDTREVRGSDRRPMWRTSELSPAVVNVTALSCPDDHTVLAATNAGVFLSRDRGEHFVNWSDGLDPPRVVALVCGPDHLVYALGLGGVLWRRGLLSS